MAATDEQDTISPQTEDGPPVRHGLRGAYGRFARGLGNAMPKGLYARSLMIILMPVVLLQAFVAFVFMERHYQNVTARLSAAVVADIAAIIEIIETFPQDRDYEGIIGIANDQLGLNISILPPDPLPPAGVKPFFSQLDLVLSREISKQIGKPFWIDTVGRFNLLEIRIQLDDKVLRVFARRSQTFQSNSLIFIGWMVATSVVLLTISILFLRNQIRPILRLANAAESFGKGRAVDELRPRGAREVRQATVAFHEMRGRIERQIEQRTAMLAGVSHDLRTILTRFRLQLALIEDSADVEAMTSDVEDMNRMLEGYLAFARGDSGEDTSAADIDVLIREVGAEFSVSGHTITTKFAGEPMVAMRPQSFKRCIANLVGNACRHANNVAIEGIHEAGYLTITVDDDGPGVPIEEQEAIFRPFYRLDNARNIDESGTGLGLSIARDIARSHGGDLTLSKSPLGGLRVTATIPA
jgi:two-component system, OmpR family, osmolarity sensor histidine kinase EnvZ